jgi:hypothetical protein
MANVQQVEHAVGEHDPLAVGARTIQNGLKRSQIQNWTRQMGCLASTSVSRGTAQKPVLPRYPYRS